LWSAIGLIFILAISVVIPNIDFIKSPFTNEINGKVVDAISYKPIPGATVIIDWGYSYGEFPMHSSGVSLKQLIITTDASGEFKAAKRLRCLAINLFPMYSRDSGGVGAIVIKKDYKHIEYSLDKNNYQVITMYKFSSKSEISVERSNLLTIKEMAKRRYKQNI